MKEKLYLTAGEAILNFDLAYPESKSDLLQSKEFASFLRQYIAYLEEADPQLHAWAVRGKRLSKAVSALSLFARQLLVCSAEEMASPYLDDQPAALAFVEGAYDYWKAHERYSITTDRRRDAESTAFVQSDSQFNQLLIGTFRRIEQTLMGRTNKVYRQQPAGTNAAVALYRNDAFALGHAGSAYSALRKVMFIDAVMLRTPMILHPRSNKREWAFAEVAVNPMTKFSENPDAFFCFPAKVGTLTVFIYFHRDFMASGVACANLFELATKEETKAKPDAILLFGIEDGLEQCSFYHDREEDLWVGSVTYSEKISYFGYMKKSVLTLHNVAMMAQGWLPIHGAFLNITLESGQSKGICLMGDSGAGKSETIEALKALDDAHIRSMEIVFDDMGTFHIKDGRVYAQGTEIGAFVRLDDLDPGTPYRDMNRSIFFNPDQSNARVITPAAPYAVVTGSHPVDLFAYANNYGEGSGLHLFNDLASAKQVFIEGKRMAKGTTQETGLSTTYFANPFGPMQQQERCGAIIDRVFEALQAGGVPIGEVYTHLGRDPENKAPLEAAARDLLRFIEG